MSIPNKTRVLIRNSNRDHQSRLCDGLIAIVVEQVNNPKMKIVHFLNDDTGYGHKDRTGQYWSNCWGVETEDLVVLEEFIVDKILTKYSNEA